jgi:Ca-activated chloride channel family protein
MMLRKPLGAALLALGFAAAGLRGESPQASFSVSVNLVKVPFSVFNDRNELVQDLGREDFRLYEDGKLQQIRSFGVDYNPVSVVLVIDTSGSVKKELDEIRDAAHNFAAALSPEDRISIITFADQPILALDWTSDKRRVRKSLHKLEPGLRTALYDAMYMAAAEQLRGIEGRKAIILLTDGLNNQSTLGFREASLSVVQSQASLYVISKTVMAREAARKERRVRLLSEIYRHFGGEEDYVDEFFRRREEEMTELADKTGGRAFFPTDYAEIRGVYAEVARELKSKYFLTYISQPGKAPNSYHRIVLEYLPPGNKLTYRRGYYFDPAPIHKRRY